MIQYFNHLEISQQGVWEEFYLYPGFKVFSSSISPGVKS